MPRSVPGHVRGALGHPGCSSTAPLWASTIWVLEAPSLGLWHRAKLWKRSFDHITGGLKPQSNPPPQPCFLRYPLNSPGLCTWAEPEGPSRSVPQTSHLPRSRRQNSLGFGYLQVFQQVPDVFVRAKSPLGALAGRELCQPPVVLGLGAGSTKHHRGYGWHEAAAYSDNRTS